MSTRVVGVDLGTRRVGVAVSDSNRTVASPYTTLDRTGDAVADRAALIRVVRELEAGAVVVGHPLSLDGRRGPAARAAEAECDELAAALAPDDVTVELFDERLTTITAAAALRRSGRDSRQARRVVDQHAAAVMLQAWLDGRAAS